MFPDLFVRVRQEVGVHDATNNAETPCAAAIMLRLRDLIILTSRAGATPPVEDSKLVGPSPMAAHHCPGPTARLVPAAWPAVTREDGSVLVCLPSRLDSHDLMVGRVMQTALVIARHAELMGGLLLHGALAERNGHGVILAGPSDVGKTTASRRLEPPFRSLSDDATLVVRDGRGDYWAHPWPTWSQLRYGGHGRSWDVQHAVRLQGIFFLTHATEDRAEPIGTGRASTLLLESSKQVWPPLWDGDNHQTLRMFAMKRFQAACDLAESTRRHILHMTRSGPFCSHIEKSLDQKDYPEGFAHASAGTTTDAQCGVSMPPAGFLG